MNTQKLEKANTLAKEMEAVKSLIKRLNEISNAVQKDKRRHFVLNIDGCSSYEVIIPEDVSEFVVTMVQTSLDKYLEKLQKEFEEL